MAKILRDSERKLIDSVAGEPDIDEPPISFIREGKQPTPSEEESIGNPDSTKSKIRNGPASEEEFGELLSLLYKDLYRIDQFWRYVENQPKGTRKWENLILPKNEDRIRQLQRLLSLWQAKIAAEETDFGEYSDKEREKIRTVLEPLAVLQPDEQKLRLKWAIEIIRKDPYVFSDRSDNDDNWGLIHILEYIGNTPDERKLRNRTYKQEQTTRWAASSRLEGELIETLPNFGDHRYTLTSRGESILNAIQNIEEASIFEDLTEAERKERWKKLIARGRGLP